MRRSGEIDEELLRQAVSRQSRSGSVLDAATGSDRDSRPPASDPQPDPPVADQPSETRRKRIALPDYDETFMHPVILRQRVTIYIDQQTKRKISDVVQRIGRGRVTLSGYIENILTNHLELYRDEINRQNKTINQTDIL